MNALLMLLPVLLFHSVSMQSSPLDLYSDYTSPCSKTSIISFPESIDCTNDISGLTPKGKKTKCCWVQIIFFGLPPSRNGISRNCIGLDQSKESLDNLNATIKLWEYNGVRHVETMAYTCNKNLYYYCLSAFSIIVFIF